MVNKASMNVLSNMFDPTLLTILKIYPKGVHLEDVRGDRFETITIWSCHFFWTPAGLIIISTTAYTVICIVVDRNRENSIVDVNTCSVDLKAVNSSC